jgi:hypothetical protein
MSGKEDVSRKNPVEEENDDMSVEEEDEANVAVQVAAVLGLGGDDAAVQVEAALAGNEQGDDVAAGEEADNAEIEAVASVVEEDDNDGDEPVVDAEDVEVDNDEEQPTVVVAMEDVEDVGDDDIPVVEAVAIVEDESSHPEPVRSAPKPKAAAKKAGTKSPKRSTAAKPKPETSTTTTKKRKKAKSATGKAGTHSTSLARIDTKRMEAANIAREMLYEAVPRLPFPVNESSSDQFFVRNFGRLKVGSDEISLKFSTPTALYPVGFSCDRYEFSPSHGRILKLRCSIIDGKVIGETGPIFRVMWGQGVDDEVDKVEYPYDPFTSSAPITSGKDDVVAVPTSTTLHQPMDQQVIPAIGMRVKARFDKDQYFHGTITTVEEREEGGNSSKSKKKKRKEVYVTILYDDGSTEEAAFPDPDITLVMPGTFLCKFHYFLC